MDGFATQDFKVLENKRDAFVRYRIPVTPFGVVRA